MASSKNSRRETPEGISKIIDLDDEFNTPIHARRKLIFEVDIPPTETKDFGHKVNPSIPEYYIDESRLTQFEKEFGYRGSDSQENRKYMEENGLPRWNMPKAYIPGLDNLDIVSKKLVQIIIEQNSWPNSSLAMENLLLQAYYHNLGEKYTGKIEAAILDMPGYEYIKPQDRDIGSTSEKAEEQTSRYIGFIDLQDKKLVQLVIDTESYPNNKIALENILKNATRLELEEKYIQKLEKAIENAPEVSYVRPEERYKSFRAGTDKREDSLDRALNKEYAPGLIEADKRLITLLIETESYHPTKTALENLITRAKKLKMDPDLIAKAESNLEYVEDSILYETPNKFGTHTITQNTDHLDGVLDDSREFSPEIYEADDKLTILVVRTKSLPESLTALATYLPYIAKLKVGSVFKFNTKSPGDSFELTINESEKAKYTNSVISKAKELAQGQSLEQLEKTYFTLGSSPKYLPIRKEIIDGINALLPDDAEGLAQKLVYATNRDAKAIFRKVILDKANSLNLYTQFEKSLGKNGHCIEKIEADLNAWQKPEARITPKNKNHKDGHLVERKHKEYQADSAHISGMTMNQVTEDGIVFKEMIGHFGESQETMEYLREHNLPLWRSTLKGDIPDLYNSKMHDIELLATAFRQGSTHKSKTAIENYLMQIIKTVPGLLKYALDNLPEEWKADPENLNNLSSRASDYHKSYTFNYDRKSETILDVLKDFIKENHNETDSKDAESTPSEERVQDKEKLNLELLIEEIASGKSDVSVIDLGMLQQIAKLAKNSLPSVADQRPDSIISDAYSTSSQTDTDSHRSSVSSADGIIGDGLMGKDAFSNIIITTEC